MTSSVIYEGGLRSACIHQLSGSTIETDAPIDNQGNGERFSPTDLVGTALASCMLTTMAIRARDMEEALIHVRIDVEKIMAANPRRISALDLTFHFPETFSATIQQQQLLEQIAMTCPVKQSIHPDITLGVHFNWP
jgi:putative redox protein